MVVEEDAHDANREEEEEGDMVQIGTEEETACFEWVFEGHQAGEGEGVTAFPLEIDALDVRVVLVDP